MPSAGGVSPPVIVALKGDVSNSNINNIINLNLNAINSRRNKNINVIYSNNYIELTTDTPECKIYFTVDNSKPLPYSTKYMEGRSTFLYQGPFLLKVGRRVVKAVAATRDGLKVSDVTTKTFSVKKVEDDDNNNAVESNTVDAGDNLMNNNNHNNNYGRPISAPNNGIIGRSVSAYYINNDNNNNNNNFNNNQFNNNNNNKWNMSYVSQTAPNYPQQQFLRQPPPPQQQPQQQLYINNNNNNLPLSTNIYQTPPMNMWGIPVTQLHNNNNNNVNWPNYSNNGISRSYNNSPYPQLGYMTNRALENLDQPRVQLDDLRSIIREEGDRLLAVNNNRLTAITQSLNSIPNYNNNNNNQEAEPKIIYVNEEPQLTAVSPGNGDWLGQVSHIYAHLKHSIATNNQLQQTFGGYKLGKLINVNMVDAAAAAADDDDDRVEISIIFKKIDGPRRKVKLQTSKTPQVINKPINNNNNNINVKNNNRMKSIANMKTMAGNVKKRIPKGEPKTAYKRDPYYMTEEYLAEGTLKAWLNFNAEADCEQLRKAMKGLGTDEKSIIDILGYRNNKQRMEVVKQFKTMFGKDLVKELKSELSGKFLTCCEALCKTPDEFDANELRKAIKGLGTDEDVLIEILCTRTNQQIETIRNTYKTFFNRDLEKDIHGDTSGHFRKLLTSQVQGQRDENLTYDLNLVQDDVTELLKAGQDKWGTDESVFNKILCQRSYAHLRALFREYPKKSNKSKTIIDVIKSEFSGDIKNALLTIVSVIENKTGYFADLLHGSMKGLGTNDDQLVRVVVSRCECDMVQIKSDFEMKYNQSLQQWIRDDISGDYLNIILALIGERPLTEDTKYQQGNHQINDVKNDTGENDEDDEDDVGDEMEEEEKHVQREGTLKPFASFDAKSDCEALRKAMKGLGTDEASIISIMSNRSMEQRIGVVQMFKTMFGKDLMSEFKSELSGNFLHVLLSLCKSKPQFYADELRSAMKGLGTDEDCLIEILCTKNNDELSEIIKEYQLRHNKSLEESIQSETSGNLKRLFVSLVQANRPKTSNINRKMARRDARMLMEAGELKKFGTDESRFNVILCSRSPSQLRATFEEYLKLSGKDIIDSIKSEMSGDLRKAFLTIVNFIRDEISYYAACLYDSMHGLGTRDEKLIRVVVGRCEIDMVQIKSEFMSKYKQTLAQYIKDDTSGDYRKILMALIGEPMK